jgi:hypothetical protein
MTVSDQTIKNEDKLHQEINSSFSCFDAIGSIIIDKPRMASQGHAIKTVLCTLLFSLDSFIPAKILDVQTFITVVLNADSSSLTLCCVWLQPVI